MSKMIEMFALKSDEGYIKVEGEGLRIVDMQKASVYMDLKSLAGAIDGIALPGGLRLSKLVITETEMGPIEGNDELMSLLILATN